jgi:hypothetical protein
MKRKVTVLRILLAIPALAGLAALATSAAAQQADGLWRCAANGSIPIGVIEIAGNQYRFTSTNTSWEPVANSANGEGSLGYDGPYLLPQDGPLADNFGVTGYLDMNEGYLDWNNNYGNLMGCRRA